MQERKQFIVKWKTCRLNVPAGVKEFPLHSVFIVCRLRGE